MLLAYLVHNVVVIMTHSEAPYLDYGDLGLLFYYANVEAAETNVQTCVLSK